MIKEAGWPPQLSTDKELSVLFITGRNGPHHEPDSDVDVKPDTKPET
jgi:hypothetical protein